jgi:hypothetical protein
MPPILDVIQEQTGIKLPKWFTEQSDSDSEKSVGELDSGKLSTNLFARPEKV